MVKELGFLDAEEHKDEYVVEHNESYETLEEFDSDQEQSENGNYQEIVHSPANH